MTEEKSKSKRCRWWRLGFHRWGDWVYKSVRWTPDGNNAGYVHEHVCKQCGEHREATLEHIVKPGEKYNPNERSYFPM